MKNKKIEDFILIIDFGSQVTKFIARRLRELNVYRLTRLQLKNKILLKK